MANSNPGSSTPGLMDTMLCIEEAAGDWWFPFKLSAVEIAWTDVRKSEDCPYG